MRLSADLRLKAILEGNEAGLWEWNLGSGEFHCDARWAAMLGYRLDDLLPTSKNTLGALCHRDDKPLAQAVLQEFLSGRQVRYETTLRFLHKTEGWRYIRTRAVLITSDALNEEWLVGSNEDVTDEYAAKQQVEQLSESVPGLIYSFVMQPDGYGYFSYISKKVEEFYGTTQEIAKKDASAVYRAVLPQDRPIVEKSLKKSANSMVQWRCDYRVRSPGHGVRWMRAIATPSKRADGGVLWQGVVINVDAEKRLELALAKQSITDELSGLYNRRYLFQRLDELISDSDRYGSRFSVLSIDIDHFKEINDTYGHQQGDQVIQAFGRLMQTRLRKSDIAARAGGEEFVVVMPHTDMATAKIVAEDLEIALQSEAFGDSKVPFKVTFSAGLVSYPEDASSLRLLMARCDQLMYAAKRRGRNQVVASS